ncbi:hypothetical protein CSE45_2660 [Citreicella sp. SE45]|nr:hypothetical protein CSE45_2660 [Citreicella sp. SE45]
MNMVQEMSATVPSVKGNVAWEHRVDVGLPQRAAIGRPRLAT